MPPLENPKWEIFCINYARTKDIGASYLAAGYKSKTQYIASVCGSKLLNNAKIKARAAELLTEALEKAKITQEEVIAILAKQARFKVNSVAARLHDSGFDWKPGMENLDDWPEEALASLESINTKVFSDGVSVPELKFSNKQNAAKILLDHFDRVRELEQGRTAPPAIMLSVNADDMKGKGAQSVIQAYQSLLGNSMKGISSKKKKG